MWKSWVYNRFAFDRDRCREITFFDISFMVYIRIEIGCTYYTFLATFVSIPLRLGIVRIIIIHLLEDDKMKTKDYTLPSNYQ